MVTIFHLFAMIGILSGGLIGWQLGFDLGGIPGAIAGAPLLAFTGFHLGNLPWRLIAWYELKKLSRLDARQLVAELYDNHNYSPNFVLTALRAKGEDVRPFLPYLCDLMTSRHFYKRVQGWVALRSALPEYAALILSYLPNQQPADRERLVQILKDYESKRNP